MNKTTDIVVDILNSSEVPLEAMRSGVLNLSAYAQQIQNLVVERAKKPVKKATIVMSLSRIAKSMQEITPLRPHVVFDEISIKSPLVDITFEKTKTNTDCIRSLPESVSQTSFLALTEGMNEVTIIASQDMEQTILSHFTSQPKALLKNLIGVTVRFSEAYIPEPNVIYAILATLASKRINLIEIISTYTELTLIVEEKNLENVVQVLNKAGLRDL